MKSRNYIFVLLLSLCLSQFVFRDMRKERIFPFATWNLFSHLPLKKDIALLYLKDMRTGEICYFYLCPRIDTRKITPFHPYHIVRWRREVSDVREYFKGKIDLQALGYETFIKIEKTTMVDKWKEISKEMESRKPPSL